MNWKALIAASSGIVAASTLGVKLANMLTGPVLDGSGAPTSNTINTVKIYGAQIGTGLAAYVITAMVLRV